MRRAASRLGDAPWPTPAVLGLPRPLRQALALLERGERRARDAHAARTRTIRAEIEVVRARGGRGGRTGTLDKTETKLLSRLSIPS